jgi:hypothetical protein
VRGCSAAVPSSPFRHCNPGDCSERHAGVRRHEIAAPAKLLLSNARYLRGLAAPLPSRHLSRAQSVTLESDGTKTLHLKGGAKLEGLDQILMAIGRKPEVSKLGLDVSGFFLCFLSLGQTVNTWGSDLSII